MDSHVPGYVADHLKITAEGVYVDGNRIPVSDDVTVEHVDDGFHAVTVRLLVKQIDVSDSPRISKTDGATYRHIAQHKAMGA